MNPFFYTRVESVADAVLLPLRFGIALQSVAAALQMDDDRIQEARIALGGVAHKPWRDREAEGMLDGKTATQESFQKAAEAMLRDAKGFGHNNFKIALAKRAIVRALQEAAIGQPKS